MTVYFIVFWLLALSALLMELKVTHRARLSLFVFSYVLLVIFVGLRWETGNDWGNYYHYFKYVTSLKDNAKDFEIGYRLLTLAVKRVGLPYAAFNLIYAAIYLGLIFESFKDRDFRVAGWLALQLYAPFLFGLIGTTRQVMAMAICMFSVRYLLSRDWRRFLLCVGLAATFHISALAFLVAWPIARLRISFRRVWVAFAILIFASVLHLGDMAYQYAESKVTLLQVADLENKLVLEQESSHEEFNNAYGSTASVMTAAGRVSLLTLFIFCLPFYTEESDKLYFKFYFFSIALVVLLSGTAFVLTERVAVYFSLFQIHLLALLSRRLPHPSLRKLCCGMLLLLSLARMWTGLHAVRPRIFIPYKGVFINQDVRRDPGWF